MSALRLGADTVARLIPHRRPFLLLDGIRAFERAPQPTLIGHKQISANEPVFEGHFPGLCLWPGVYTIEGMGQTTNALLVILAMIEAFEQHGATEQDVLSGLKSLDQRGKRGARAPSEAEGHLVRALGEPLGRVGLAGSVEVKLIEPVYAGVTLVYRARLTHVLGDARRFDVEATVDDRPVARGSITSALQPGVLLGGPR